VRALAGRLAVRPTKALGQNFVVDANTVRRIVTAAALEPGEVVVEIGPGLGSLTLGLVGSARVVAVEVDPALASELTRTVAHRRPDRTDALEVVAADALEVDPAALARFGAPTALVANLPYNVAVPVLLRMMEVLPTVQHGLVMVQAEVADRLAAPPGSRTYGVPSVKASWYADVRHAGSIARTVFWPAPNVDSALVAWRRRPAPECTVGREQVFAVVDAAFAQRRKTLRAALASWAGSPAAAELVLRQAGIDPSLRGERLDVADFARLADARGSRAP
jgi:16S rRNA (adenine1518-N6/adenine1519-N6)-dimethyltransferase